jgi:hypothetical protein
VLRRRLGTGLFLSHSARHPARIRGRFVRQSSRVGNLANIAWEITHSVETTASPAFAWKYWTTVPNWSDPPAEFELQGAFEAGSRGLTRFPDQPPIEWFLREVCPPTAATIAMPLAQAVLCFAWRFDALREGRTRISQRITLEGENAEAYRSQVASAFANNLPDAMKKIARAMAEAHAFQPDARM